MTPQVLTRLKILIAQKEHVTGERITYERIQAETGVATSTLVDWANSKVTRFDAGTLTALCSFFDVTIGDMLVMTKKTNPTD